MGGWLRQSTADSIIFGPFLSKTDGVTPTAVDTTIASIDHASTGITLSKNGATSVLRNDVKASVGDTCGMFHVHLDATDTNTAGHLRIMKAEPATYLPVWDDYMVLPANTYDTLVGNVEGTLDLGEVLRIMLAALAGKATGGGTTTVKFRNIADNADRITATVDGDGNRTAVTLDGA
jgi:hypothetical protein